MHTSQRNLLTEMWVRDAEPFTTGCVFSANVMIGFQQHLDSFVAHVRVEEAKLKVMSSDRWWLILVIYTNNRNLAEVSGFIFRNLGENW